MTSINQKLGLRPAGPRAMMKHLPKNRELRTKVTSAKCPACDRTGAHLSHVKPGWLVCGWCTATWELPA
jgi:hypothetical protein